MTLVIASGCGMGGLLWFKSPYLQNTAEVRFAFISFASLLLWVAALAVLRMPWKQSVWAMATGAGAALPLAVLIHHHMPVESGELYPVTWTPLIEELTKLTAIIAVVHLLGLVKLSHIATAGIGVGAGFAAAENFLYLLNYAQLKNMNIVQTVFEIRVVETPFIHPATALLLAVGVWSVKNNPAAKLWPAMLCAMGVHAGWNWIVRNSDWLPDAHKPALLNAVFLAIVAVSVLLLVKTTERELYASYELESK